MKKSISITIRGVKPLLMHAFREDVFDKKKAKSGSVGNNPDEWKGTVIMDEERKLYLPNSYLFAPIRESGKYTKIGRGNIVKHIASTLEVSPDKIYVVDANGQQLIVPEDDKITRETTSPVYLDVRSVVNPMTKGRNLRYRVASAPGWTATFVVTWDDSVLSVAQMQQSIKDAGVMCGTGCGRAIGFGRFEVIP